MKKVFTPEQKADVAIAAIKGIQSTSQISSMFEVHPTQVGLWKKQALRGLSDVFSDKRRKVQDELAANRNLVHYCTGKLWGGYKRCISSCGYSIGVIMRGFQP